MEDASYFGRRAACGQGGIVDLDDVPMWRMSLGSTVGDFISKINICRGVSCMEAVRGKLRLRLLQLLRWQ